MFNKLYHGGASTMNEEKEKIILPKALQDEMVKFFFDVAVRQRKQQQFETRLSEKNDRSEE